MRLTKTELKRKIKRMLRDPGILTRPECETILKHKAHSRLVKQVRHKLIAEKVANGEPVHEEMRVAIEIRRLKQSLSRAEERHPGILKHILRTGNGQSTADEFKLSRQRVSQLRQIMQRFAKLTDTTMERIPRKFR